MANDKNDVVILNLDRPRELRFGHKALKTLIALTGKDIDAINIGEGMDLEEIEKIVYCGLLSDARANGETLKLEDMEDLLDQAQFSEIITKMTEALKKAFGSIAEGNMGNGMQATSK